MNTTPKSLNKDKFRALGVKHDFKNCMGNTTKCYGTSDQDADYYELFVGKEQEGILENPDKLGWAEVTEFLKKQPDDWSEVFGIKSK